MNLVEITIPVLNEEADLEEKVGELLRFLELQQLPGGLKSKVVIADNGSDDRTQEIAEKLALEENRIEYIRLEERGVGRALKASWGQSTADIVGYMDLDLATDLRHFPEAMGLIVNEGADIVTGSRLHANSKVRGRTLTREVSSRGFNFILKIAFMNRFSDGMCGFKFLRRAVYPQLNAAGADNDGWFFATELLVTSEWLQLKLRELPVEWTDSPNSKVNIPKLAMRYLKAIRALRARRPLKG